MFAVIQTGGKQYRVSQGDKLKVEKLVGDVGSKITFDKVLLIAGDSVKVGAPLIAGAKVEAEIVTQGRGPKIIVFKFKRRKNYRRKNGHRQPFTEVKVTGIGA
ncbi:MAG: 50S ribosomal protein L21 [Polyangiales bacterium]